VKSEKMGEWSLVNRYRFPTFNAFPDADETRNAGTSALAEVAGRSQ